MDLGGLFRGVLRNAHYPEPEHLETQGKIQPLGGKRNRWDKKKSGFMDTLEMSSRVRVTKFCLLIVIVDMCKILMM